MASWAKEARLRIIDEQKVAWDLIHLAIRDTIQEAARRVCTCGPTVESLWNRDEVDLHWRTDCPARKVLEMETE